MNIQNWSETLLDYNAVSNANSKAFTGWYPDYGYVPEPVMADLPGQGKNDDSDLSLIAGIAGEVSGHVLLSIYQYIEAGMVQQGAVSASVAVNIAFQRKEIGVIPVFAGVKSLQELMERRAA